MLTPDLRQEDEARADLDLLLALALARQYRVEHGEWPSTLPPLYPEPAPLNVTALRLEPGTQGTLEVRVDESSLEEMARYATPRYLLRLTASP